MPSGDTGEEQNQKSIDYVCLIQTTIFPTSYLTKCYSFFIHRLTNSEIFSACGTQRIGYKYLINIILQLTQTFYTFKMALIEQSYLQSLLNDCELNFGREEKEAKNVVLAKLTEIQKILKQNVKRTFSQISLEVIVRFLEFAIEIQQKFEYADDFVNLFFQRVTAPSQFYIRALLVRAKLIAYKGHKNELKGEAIIAVLKQSLQQINKALDLISGPNEPAQKGKDSKGAGGDSNKTKYGFLIYNASTCLYKIIRFMLKQNWQKNFTDIVERVFKLLQEIDEPDQNWRCRFMLILFQCLYDSDKKADAWKILDLLWEKAKSKNVDFLDSLFRLRVHYSKQNNALGNIIKKDIQGADPNGWKILEILQRMRSGAIPEAQVQKQLMGVVNQISLGVLSTNQQSASITLSPVMQERLGQAGRIALKFNIINIANSIINFLAKARQPNQKAMVLNEYNKAELLIKKKNQFIDKKTGMMMNSSEIKELQIERRKEALKILQKVMMANKKLDNPDLIYEGAILIWNISLPFLCPQYRESVAKAFDYSCQLLEQIDSTDHDLRVKMHLQLAKIYFGNESMFQEVDKNITKALKLDHSLAAHKVQHKFEPQQDLSLYYRPFERYLHSFRDRIKLKNLVNSGNKNQLDTVINDLWNVADQKSETTRIDTLQSCLSTLMNMKQQKYVVDQSKMLVEQEIKQQKIIYDQQKLRNYKKKKLLSFDVAEMSFQWELNNLAKKACKFVLEDKWEGKNSIQLVIVQARCCYFLAQIQIDQLIQDNFQVPFSDPIYYQNDEAKQNQLTQEKKKQIEARKKSIFQTMSKGLQLAESIQQYWLVFNGAIYLWNNFLHVFRNPINDSKLHKDLCSLLKKFFESMKNSLKQIEAKGIVYYDLDTKIQTFANIGLVYARLMESQKQSDQVIKICDALLVTPLSPHTRKLTNSMKARVTGSGGGKAAGGAKDQKKGAKDAPQQKAGGYSDSFLFEIFSQLQIIQNSTNKTETQNMIKKCFENLQSWEPKDKDQSELQLHAELWARLARLAVNQNSTIMYKYALRCSENSFSLIEADKNIQAIPPNRLRWYSLSQFLYSQCLFKISNPQTQDTESYEKLLFGALQHAVEAVNKGYKSNVNALVVDGAKQVWNICSKLQDSKKNRAKLIQPLKSVLYYLKEIKQQNEVDLVLLLAQLFFKCANQNNESKIGQEVTDILFSIVPKNMQKSLWQAKMIFMSKQGKNELQAISNMKQADPSLQSKLWVKLARIANNPKKQHAAYNKAIEILKKQNSIQIVEVLIQYSEWQLRVGNEKIKNVMSNLLLASDYLIDIQFGEDQQEDDIQEDKGTVFSRSTRGKKSHASKSAKSQMKSSKITKKMPQKKGPSSNKSKASSGASRMSRSGRVAKATKSKNTKSIFSERQQDPNPESLNCIHYERLFRIHCILALISDSVGNKIRYALDAKHFLIKILELSLNTANKMQKYTDKNKNSKEFNLKVPNSLKQWVNFQLNKEILDKVKTAEDPNFMGIYTFEKPQLTYAYLKNLTEIFLTYGLNYHTIPINFFKKFIANQILDNKNYFEVADLEMKLILKNIGYEDPQKPGLIQISMDKYKLSEVETKMQITKTQSKVVVEQSDANIFQNIQPPNLVQPASSYEAWFQIGKLLSRFGEIYTAKLYLKEAYKHFTILSNSEQAGECCIELLVIATIEGQQQQAMEQALNANKLCKQTKNWNKLLYESCKFFLSLKKYEDIANFSSKVYSTIQELISSLNKENSQKLIFQSEMIELKDILTLIQVIDLDVRFTESYEEEILNPVKGILTAVRQIEERVISGDLWTIQNYTYFLNVANKIIQFFIFGKEKGTQITTAVFDKTFSLVLKIEKKIFELMKYTLVNTGSEFKKNQLIDLYQKFRYAISNSYMYQSTQQLSGDNLLKEEDQQQRDQVEQLIDLKNDHFRKYMETLNLQIQKKLKPVPLNLSPIQSSISILQNIKTHLVQDSYQAIEWAANYIRSLTLTARGQGALQSIWTNQSQEIQAQAARLSLESMLDFLTKNSQEKLLNFSQNSKCYEAGQKLYQSFLQNTGQVMKQKSFQFLCKLQHCSYTRKIIQIVRQNLNPSHKLNSYLRLIENININPQKIKASLSNDKIFTALTKFPTYEQCLAFVPRNSVYIVIQMNLNLSEIYCGILSNQKGQQQYQLNIKILKKTVQKKQLSTYWLLRQKLSKINKQIVYLAYSDSKKLDSLLQDKQNSLQQIHNQFVKMNNWWVDELLPVLNKVKEAPPPVDDKNKKGAKDAKKKGGKDEVVGYESPLGASPSGIQSITFLLDDFFEAFPFNLLPGLECVPSISFDSSLFYLARKMQSIGFKADANNSNGFAADKGKYVSYEFKNPELGFKSMSTQITKQSPNLKFEGVSSNDRIPSIGDYKKYFNQNGYLQIYGSLDFLNHIRLPILFESCGISKLKLLIITDHLNYEKSLINKFIPLDNQSQINPIDEQRKLLKATANLLDLNLIKNYWCLNKQQNFKMITNFYKNLGSGYYLGSCLNSKEEGKEKNLLERYMNRIHGCPVLRI